MTAPAKTKRMQYGSRVKTRTHKEGDREKRQSTARECHSDAAAMTEEPREKAGVGGRHD